MEEEFGLRNLTSDGFVGCSCYCFLCGFRPILCQMHKGGGKRNRIPVSIQYYEKVQSTYKKIK